MTALQIECVRGIPSIPQDCMFCGIECVNGRCPVCDDGLRDISPDTTLELWGEPIDIEPYYDETDGRHWGYAAGNDLFDCLWYELIASCRNAA